MNTSMASLASTSSRFSTTPSTGHRSSRRRGGAMGAPARPPRKGSVSQPLPLAAAVADAHVVVRVDDEVDNESDDSAAHNANMSPSMPSMLSRESSRNDVWGYVMSANTVRDMQVTMRLSESNIMNRNCISRGLH